MFRVRKVGGEAEGFPCFHSPLAVCPLLRGAGAAAGCGPPPALSGARSPSAFCKRGCAGAAGPWLFATTFLMRLTTHDKLSYMETKSRFDGIYVPQRYKPGVAVQTKEYGVDFLFYFIFFQ